MTFSMKCREWGINPKTIDFRNDAAKIASYTALDIKGFAVTTVYFLASFSL